MFSWVKKIYKKSKKAVKRAAYKKAIQYWIWWSNWNLRKESFRKTLPYIERHFTFSKLKKCWSQKTKDLKWKPDGAEFLFDSMTTSQNIIKNGGDDCDGFAWLSFVYYKDSGFVLHNSDHYHFDHFHTYRYKATGHVVAVFKSRISPDVVFSNQFTMFLKDYHSWDHATNESEIRVNSKNKLYLHKII